MEVDEMHQSDETETESEIDFESELSSNISADDNDECEQIKHIFVTGQDFYGNKQFIYFEKVDVTITNCSFYGSVEFTFYVDASIKFEKNNCYESAFFKGFGKLQTKFIGCKFYGSKKVVFDGNSLLNCEENDYYGSVSYECLSELNPEFQGCNFFASKKCFDAFTNFSITTQNETIDKTSYLEPILTKSNEMFKSVCTFKKEKISKLQDFFELLEVNPKTNLSDDKTDIEENRNYGRIIMGHFFLGLIFGCMLTVLLANF